MKYSIPQIKEDFIKVIKYSQHIENPQVDRLFEIWENNKKEIIKAFGNKLIYEVKDPVTFELSDEAKESRVSSFINFCWQRDLSDLATFLENERDGFFKNRCNKDHSNGIQKGTKLVKAFKYYVTDKTTLHELQNKASQIIQENKVEGKLCFSVHPLDYLSISENTHNWRSCHALDGEYRAGNLSYMMDESTIVCYLKSKEGDMKLPNFPEDVLWNSKKWRVLLYLSNDWKMIFAGKQYPFSTSSGMELLIEKYFNIKIDNTCYRKPNVYRFNSSYKGSTWSPWTDVKISKLDHSNIHFEFYDDYIPLNEGILKITDLVKDASGSKHFNDVLRSSCYSPIYTYLLDNDWYGKKYALAKSSKTRFNIGHHTHCLYCGKEETMNSGSSTMMCYDCEKDYGVSVNEYFSFCHHCNQRIITENGYYVEEEMYCNDCFNEITEKCECCGDYYLKENLIYNEEQNVYYCKWCNGDKK